MSTTQPDRANWVFEKCLCDLCPHRARCRSGDSCDAFASFVQWGGRRWRNEARKPSRKMYKQIFGRCRLPSVSQRLSGVCTITEP